LFGNGVWVNRNKSGDRSENTGTGGIWTGMVPVVRVYPVDVQPSKFTKASPLRPQYWPRMQPNHYVPVNSGGQNGPYKGFIEISKKNWSSTFKAFDRYRRYIW
jgi:hypothetical protein